MLRSLRSLARRLLAVRRTPTYYLPWITRPGLECALLLNNIEARFKSGYNHGPFPIRVVQYNASGCPARRYDVRLADSTDAVELCLEGVPESYGFVTIDGERMHSDLYVTLSDGSMYTATHGRGEFVETYPIWVRAAWAVVGAALAAGGQTIPAFVRDQYVYVGPESRSHLLLMNLSNVTNRIRVEASIEGSRHGARLLTLPPMGALLLDVADIEPARGAETAVWRVRLKGNAWFNLYLVGAGPRDLAGPLSLMHVK